MTESGGKSPSEPLPESPLAPAPAPLAGLTALVVEDEAVIGFMVEDMLADLGCRVAGVAPDVETALGLLAAEPVDIAVLDVNLGNERSFPVADALRRRRIPFLFATGYGAGGIPAGYSDVPVLAKPYSSELLRRSLTGLVRPAVHVNPAEGAG